MTLVPSVLDLQTSAAAGIRVAATVNQSAVNTSEAIAIVFVCSAAAKKDVRKIVDAKMKVKVDGYCDEVEVATPIEMFDY